jgi:hypothetical protein
MALNVHILTKMVKICLENRFINKKNRMDYSAVLWIIWSIRNDVCFDEKNIVYTNVIFPI